MQRLSLPPAVVLAAALGLAACPAVAQDLQAIPGARDWQMEVPWPGDPYTACTARAAGGGPLATTLRLDTSGQPVLVALRADWANLAGPADATLAIDGGPPEPIKVTFAASQMLAPLDPARLQRLRAARTLDWTLPVGRFQARVDGFGAALDAVLACRANGPLTAS